MGDGRHWMSWIHRDDLVDLILRAMADPAWVGPINGTAPEPVTNRAFAKALAGALRRPAWLAVPGWPLKMLLGDMARELLLAGPRVVPQAALAAGFAFRYPDLDTALADFFPGPWPEHIGTGKVTLSCRGISHLNSTH
jgi:NAD dependent epimerase/dehydratase family enzyme